MMSIMLQEYFLGTLSENLTIMAEKPYQVYLHPETFQGDFWVSVEDDLHVGIYVIKRYLNWWARSSHAESLIIHNKPRCWLAMPTLN